MPNELHNFLNELYYAKTPQEIFDEGYYDQDVVVTFAGKSVKLDFDLRLCGELLYLIRNYQKED